jgi:hypothetical protein
VHKTVKTIHTSSVELIYSCTVLVYQNFTIEIELLKILAVKCKAKKGHA